MWLLLIQKFIDSLWNNGVSEKFAIYEWITSGRLNFVIFMDLPFLPYTGEGQHEIHKELAFYKFRNVRVVGQLCGLCATFAGLLNQDCMVIEFPIARPCHCWLKMEASISSHIFLAYVAHFTASSRSPIDRRLNVVGAVQGPASVLCKTMEIPTRQVYLKFTANHP